MIAPIDKAPGEGNCAAVTAGGEEAGAKAARLRTETRYKAGGAGEWAHHHEAVASLIPLVNREPRAAKVHALIRTRLAQLGHGQTSLPQVRLACVLPRLKLEICQR